MSQIASAREVYSHREEDSSLSRYSWAIDMEYPLELGKLSRLSHYGLGIGKELQIPEWDFKSTIDTKPLGRLFLQKTPRDVFTTELKREMVDNDRRLKSSMTRHRKLMQKEAQLMERGSTMTPTTNSAAPLTVMDAETLVSEQYVVCRICKKTYKEGLNTETSCRYHRGPLIAVFGGMCQNCGMLDYTSGCVVGFHTRKKQHTATRKRDTREKPISRPVPVEDEGIQV